MNLVAVLVCAAAAAVFLYDAAVHRGIVSLGLFLFVVGFVLTFVVQTGTYWVIH